MDRRKTLKLLATGALTTPLALSGCKPPASQQESKEPVFSLDRNPDEVVMEKKLLEQASFFSAEEMATLTILVDIIIPADGQSGSASEAGVPAFLEFIVKDMPQHQIPLRGGLRWLDMHCLHTYQRSFFDCTEKDRLAVIDKIAYPLKADKKMQQGVHFFSLLRDLTATGFYTSAQGVKDLDYKGNQPNQWDGVPSEVLSQYGVSYTPKDLKDCISYGSQQG